MPKLTPQQTYDKFAELEKKGDIEGLVQHMSDCYGDEEMLTSAKKFYEDFAESVKEAQGPEKARKEKLAADWAERLIKEDVMTRIDAGTKMADYEKKIRNGEVPDTEHIVDQKNVVKAIAHDLVHNSVIGNKYMGLNHARMDYINALSGKKVISSEQTNNYQVKRPVEMLDEIAAEKGMDKNKIKDYALRAESFEASAVKYDFVVKDDVKTGEYPFSKIPDNVTKLKGASDQELEQMINDKEKQMDDLLKFEQAALGTKITADSLLKELEETQPKGHENSIEYDEMHEALENITRLGNGMIYKRGEMRTVQWDLSSKIIDGNLDVLEKSAQNYEQTHKNPSQQYGKDRRALATRIKEFAGQHKQLLKEAKSGFNANVISGIKNRNKEIDMITKEQEKRGLVPKDFKREPVQPVTRVDHDDLKDEMISQRSKLDGVITDARKTNKKVHMGSSEFNKSIEKMKAVSEAYKDWLKVADSKDKTLQREKIEALQKKLADAQKATDKYLKRKQDQGLISESGDIKRDADERTKERMDLMKNANTYILPGIRNVANIVSKNLNLTNPAPARARYEEQIKNSKGSNQLAARGALGAVNILTRISDKAGANGALAPEDASKTRMSIAALTYNELLKTANVKPRATNVDQYTEQVRQFANSPEFKKCIPQEINADTLKNFIENENASKELLSQITKEKSKNLENDKVNKTINNPEKKLEDPSLKSLDF